MLTDEQLSDPAKLPARLHLPQVLELAGYSRTTLWKRQRAGVMPRPIDRGAFGGIYDRDAVLKGLGRSAPTDLVDPWMSDPVEYKKAEERMRRKEKRPRK